MQCLVMAGGLGTRMGRFTDRVPKALIPVNGEPFIRRQLRNLEMNGIQEVVISTGYLGHLIEQEISKNAPGGLAVSCVPDGEVLLGTGGSVRRLSEMGLLDEVFMYTYGDSFLTVDHADVASAFEPATFDALMTVCENSGGHETSNAVVVGDRVVTYRKGLPVPDMNWIDYGLSVIKRETVDWLVPLGEPSDISGMFETLAERSRLQAYCSSSRYFEIGSETGLAELEQYLGSSA